MAGKLSELGFDQLDKEVNVTQLPSDFMGKMKATSVEINEEETLVLSGADKKEADNVTPPEGNQIEKQDPKSK